MIRLLAAAPWLIAGQAITDVGFWIAGARHLNPHRRPS